MDNSERPRLKFVLAMIPLLALAPMRACATSKLAVNNPGAAAASEATDGPVVCGTCGDVGPEDDFRDHLNPSATTQRVSGRVLTAGLPSKDYLMTLVSKDRSFTAETRTNEKGEYEFRVPVGEYFLFPGKAPDTFDSDEPFSLWPIKVHPRQPGGAVIELGSPPQHDPRWPPPLPYKIL
jgi:hypothetical protein